MCVTVRVCADPRFTVSGSAGVLRHKIIWIKIHVYIRLQTATIMKKLKFIVILLCFKTYFNTAHYIGNLAT